jgi:uncharacterized membrane protein (UPF0127 family)
MLKLVRETIREMLLQGPEMKTLAVGGFPITVELAMTPEDQSIGLMHRQDLDPDCGMLFCYDDPRDLSFWMRDTSIPLSIAFIDDEGRVVNVEDLHPHDESHVSSSRPCRWALEAHRGWFSSRGVRTGTIVKGLPGL